MEDRQKRLEQLNDNADENGLDDGFDNKMDDTNFDQMEWDQKEGP